MKSVLISIQPKWCKLIANGSKTIEVRKSRPQLETPFKCYIYETKGKEKLLQVCHIGDSVYGVEVKEQFFVRGDYQGRGKVIGEFTCDRIDEFTVGSLGCDDIQEMACMAYSEMIDYFYKPNELDGKTVKFGYGWHISALKIYDKPKELSEYWKYNEELHKCLDDEGFCCYDGIEPNGCAFECWGYVNVLNCYKCWNEWSGWCKKLTRPPQSWGYVEGCE